MSELRSGLKHLFLLLENLDCSNITTNAMYKEWNDFFVKIFLNFKW